AITVELINVALNCCQPTHPTMEDIYTAVIETDRGVKEKVRIFDLGMPDGNEADIPKHYLTLPDGFILVYDATNFDSFKRLDKLKKEIDKHKDKREVSCRSRVS
uniref:Uncharacterized protein n=1 Tax=Biomphalaria glabrata TaxID=6526 RepID=A0A2C9L304_BIOGL